MIRLSHRLLSGALATSTSMRRNASRVLIEAGRQRLVWSLAVCLLLVCGTIAALNLLPAPATIVVIEGRTEYLQYSTFNPQLSAFPVDGLRVAFADDTELESVCLAGTLTPNINSTITYVARQSDPLAISVTGTGGTVTADGQARSLAGEISLFSDPTCGVAASARFPVWGPGRIGSLFTVRHDGIGPLLLAGSLNVFGRTSDLGFFGEGGALYTALAQPFALPPGGTIWTDGTDQSSANPASLIPAEQAALFGFVALGGEGGLSMRLTTETPILQVLTPGGSLEANRIEIGLFAQILNDPNILRIQVMLLLFFFLLPIVIDLTSLSIPPREKPDAPENEEQVVAKGEVTGVPPVGGHADRQPSGLR